MAEQHIVAAEAMDLVLPPRPQITSSPGVPLIRSLAGVPLIVPQVKVMVTRPSPSRTAAECLRYAPLVTVSCPLGAVYRTGMR